MKTIKDVAKKAGVGIATVSRYINKNGYVSKESEKKIANAMKVLKYYPNAAAQSIKSKKSNTVALVIPTITNLFFPELANALENMLSEQGYKLILCNSEDDLEKENRYVDMILQNRIDGVVTATGYVSERLIESGLPIILLDRVSDQVDDLIVSVTSNHYDGAVKATNHLLENGCKKLLHLYGPLKTETATLRKNAFVNTCNDNDIEYKCLSVKDDLNYDTLKNYDGVFIWNDIDSIKFISECLTRGINIPNDIQVIGFDNIELSNVVYPQLTTISQPISELGKKACELLIEMIDNKEVIKENIILDTNLVIRKTTKG
ncbi:LacI family DNA-binding transcriptional regulator [Mycoplasmatota bacterium WC44]